MSTVTSKDLAMLVNENWNSKAELSDVFRQGGDLLRRMSPGVAQVGLDRINGHAFDFGISHQSLNASCLIGCQPAVLPDFFALALLVPPDCTLTSTSSSRKAVDGVRRAHDGDSRLNRLRNVV